ncbi:fungal-specific transcription factor domain-containing protein [Bisporella sp. PMI_857]|nr:fungal-specific transcription factor domain-containing protein [Bisporella sp. PMI_857]
MPKQMTTTEVSNNSNGCNSGSKRKYGSDWVRKRVSQACDQCRKKKLKCDGLRPICSTCVSLGRQCFYGDAVKKRGLPEGYVRGLEKLLGLLLPDAGSLESVTELFEGALQDEAAKTDLIRQWNVDESENGDNLHEIWRASKLCKSLEHLLPLLDSGDNKGQEGKRPRLEPHSVSYGGYVAAPIKFSLQLPPREVAEDLFNIYFTYTHCWLPIIGKDEMLAAYYRTLELSASSLGIGEHAAIWAVLAYAECQRSSPPRESRGMGYLQQSPEAESYYDKARSLIPSEGSDLSIGHVQALLVLSLVKLAMGQFRASWLLVSQAINIAIDISINTSSSCVHGTSVGRPKNVFLGCFYLDTLISACLRRGPRLTREDALSIGFLDENGLEEWGYLELGERPRSSRILSMFNHLVRLACVLNDLAHDQATGRSQEKRLEDAQTMFNDWKDSLPDYCSLKTSSDSISRTAPIPPHQLNLDITFLICKGISERGPSVSTGKLLEDVNALHQILGVHNSHSAYRSSVFPPAFCLISILGLDNVGSSKHQWTQTLLQAGSSGIDDAPTRVDTFREGIPARVVQRNPDTHFEAIRKSPDIGTVIESREGGNFVASSGSAEFDPSINSLTTHSGEDAIIADSLNWLRASGLHSIDARTSFSPGPWVVQNDTLSPMATVESLCDGMSVQENVEISPACLTKHPDNYSAARNLFHLAQSSQASGMPQTGQDGKARVRNPKTSFSVLNPAPTGIGGSTLDPVLQCMATVDDHFLELSNLDHFTGDQDETYRHLGFLLPSDLQGQFTSPNRVLRASTDCQDE